jgi:hypothetical protein
MYIERRCACNRLLRIQVDLVGRHVRCPSCKQISVWDDAPTESVADKAPKRNPLENPSALAAAIVAAIKKHE